MRNGKRRHNPMSSDYRLLGNDNERAFQLLAMRNDWTVTKRGWPDFLCYGPNGRIIAVEVKPRQADGFLKSITLAQNRAMKALTKLGVECYVSDGETLEPFDPARHYHEGVSVWRDLDKLEAARSASQAQTDGVDRAKVAGTAAQPHRPHTQTP